MRKSIQIPLLTPEQALALARTLYPPCELPDTGTALLYRSERGNGPPTYKDERKGTPPSGRRMYPLPEVRKWCLERQPAAVRAALENSLMVCRLAEEASINVEQVLSEIDPRDPWAKALKVAFMNLEKIIELSRKERES